MGYLQATYKNRKHAFKRFLPFFLCCYFTIVIFFIYSIMLFNPYIIGDAHGFSLIKFVITTCNIVIIVFASLFISYAASASLRARKQEFGLYYLLGFSDREIKSVIHVEHLVIGFIALVTGLLSGALIARTLINVLANVLYIQLAKFVIKPVSILVTIMVFGLLFLIADFKSIKIITHAQIVELLSANKKPQEISFYSIKLGLLGLILLPCMLLGLFILNTNTIIFISFLIICYFLFFRQGGLTILNYLKKRKSLYYKFNNMLLISRIKFNIANNWKTMFISALLQTTILILIGLAYAGYAQNEDVAEKRYSVDLSLFSSAQRKCAIDPSTIKTIEAKYHKEMQRISTVEFLVTSDLIHGGRACVISSSHYAALTRAQMPQLSLGTAMLIIPVLRQNNISPKHVKLLFNNQEETFLVVKTDLDLKFAFNDNAQNFVVVNNQDYQRLKFTYGQEFLGSLYNYMFVNWRQSQEIINDITKILASNNPSYDITNLSSKITWYQVFHQFSARLVFLAVFVGFIFYLATGGIFIFKQMNEMPQFRAFTKALTRIGVTSQEMRGIIKAELALGFFSPFVLSMVISCPSIVSFIYKTTATTDIIVKMVLNSLVVFILFGLLQVAYYWVAQRVVYNQIGMREFGA